MKPCVWRPKGRGGGDLGGERERERGREGGREGERERERERGGEIERYNIRNTKQFFLAISSTNIFLHSYIS